MQKLLEVAAANEIALKRLVAMVDDFDKRLKTLEGTQPPKYQITKSRPRVEEQEVLDIGKL